MRGRLILEDGTSKLGGMNHLARAADEHRQRRHHRLRHFSWHSALIGEMMIEDFARIRSEVEYASEFRYRNPIITPTHAVHRDFAVG